MRKALVTILLAACTTAVSVTLVSGDEAAKPGLHADGLPPDTESEIKEVVSNIDRIAALLRKHNNAAVYFLWFRKRNNEESGAYRKHNKWCTEYATKGARLGKRHRIECPNAHSDPRTPLEAAKFPPS